MQISPREAPALVRPYRLIIPDQVVRLAAGDLLGRGAGGSVEYQDHRAYYPGDDIRHIDWRAYARSGRLALKMYRREITPAVDVILDASLSTGSSPEKLQLALGVAAVFHFLGLQARAQTALYASGRKMRPVPAPTALESVTLEREPDLLQAFVHAPPTARRRGIRMIVSDFLFPLDPAALVAALGRNADRLILAQTLSRFEANPEALGGTKLVDAETDESLDLIVDAEAIRRYRQRLDNLRAELDRQCRRVGGAFVSLDPTLSGEDVLRELARRGIVQAA